MIDWSQCPALESVPGKLGGKWVIRGTRVPIEMLFVNLASGASVDDFVEWFEGIPRERYAELLQFLAEQSQSPTQAAEPAAA